MLAAAAGGKDADENALRAMATMNFVFSFLTMAGTISWIHSVEIFTWRPQ
jgi:hypothetical protein